MRTRVHFQFQLNIGRRRGGRREASAANNPRPPTPRAPLTRRQGGSRGPGVPPPPPGESSAAADSGADLCVCVKRRKCCEVGHLYRAGLHVVCRPGRYFHRTQCTRPGRAVRSAPRHKPAGETRVWLIPAYTIYNLPHPPTTHSFVVALAFAAARRRSAPQLGPAAGPSTAHQTARAGRFERTPMRSRRPRARPC